MILVICVIFMTACEQNENREYVHWGEKTEIDIQRLTNNRIDFKVKNDNIYIPEELLKNAVACCT
ncbi:hypothetical protein ABE65_010750 [Fictibacillus phosphorivorans]|uniref:Uncharacterized protein n=1 Tax=Fictibacillus phosphorivorans TaxID=1221500 RepID=A0A160IMQ6_9BACL|nr:hypothetical protein ABE65_010750 [Fictibacillus phosphorivorans]